MSSHLRIGACSLIACGALALPAGANAADITTAVNQVRAHTDRADSALDRAVALFEKNSDRKARVAYAKSRKEMGLAKADATKARRQADTPNEHSQAARAQALLAAQQDENIQTLTNALRPAGGGDESKIAAAARADTKGREKAIAILTQPLAQVPEQARTAIAKAIANLSTDRVGEVSAMSKALVSSDGSNTNKRRVVATLKVDLEGQTDAAKTLAALIASPGMPAQSKQGLQTAYDNIIAEHGSVADILSRLSDRMPSFVRDFVTQIITQAPHRRAGHARKPPDGSARRHPRRRTDQHPRRRTDHDPNRSAQPVGTEEKSTEGPGTAPGPSVVEHQRRLVGQCAVSHGGLGNTSHHLCLPQHAERQN